MGIAKQFGFFNPLAPCGARRTARRSCWVWRTFQSTRPLRGETNVGGFYIIDDKHFQSTRPLRGETITSAFIWLSVSSFQSTRPLRGETVMDNSMELRVEFSIHSPLAGRDDPYIVDTTYPIIFNPLAPCGARPKTGLFPGSMLPFSIHSPLAGRDKSEFILFISDCIFNPLAPCGARHKP